MEAIPAAVAAWIPMSASSKTRQAEGSTPRRSAARRKGSGAGFGVGVVAGADEGVEEMEDAEGFEGADDGLAGAAGDYGEGDAAVVEVDLLEDLGDGLELVDEFVVEALFAMGELGEGDGEVVAVVEFGDDGVDGATTPGVEELFGEGGAAVFVEGFVPGDVVQGHGVGDGAVAVEEVGLEVAFGELQGHAFIVSQVVSRWKGSCTEERLSVQTFSSAMYSRRETALA